MSIRFHLFVILGLIANLMMPEASFAQSRKKGPDQLFAYHLFRATEMISREHANPVSQAQQITWAIQGLYAEFHKPIPPQLTQRLAKIEQAKDAELLQFLRDAHTLLFDRKKDEDLKAVEICVNAICRKLEPAACPEEQSGFFRPEFLCKGLPYLNLTGVGLKLKSDPDTGMLRVITPIYQSPSYNAGIRAGDLVTHIRMSKNFQGEPLPQEIELSTKGMTPNRAYELLLGVEGTAVTLKIVRAK